MKKYQLIRKISGLILVTSLIITLIACGTKKTAHSSYEFDLISEAEAAPIVVLGKDEIGYTEGDYPGVVRATHDLKEDIKAVTGREPFVTDDIEALGDRKFAILVGSYKKSTLIQELHESGVLDLTDIIGKWEDYIIQTVNDPFGDGSIETALVVAGSDKRGTIFGIYKISEMLGVSPWGYFGDQVPSMKDNLNFEANYRHHQGEPTVQYRGVFFNDEEKLAAWSRKLDDGKNMGPNIYREIFEVLLRMNANYIWPAMHGASDAFSDHLDNPVIADYYGIVVGTSHVDMMMRNNNNEWDAFVAKYKAEHNYTGTIEYDYTVNPEILQVYWREAVEIYKDYEVQYSLGMRGKHDVPFSTKNINDAPWYGDRGALLEQIIEDQRQILREVLNKDNLDDVFQIFTPYKEVQEIYNNGLNLPEDITVLWVNDNHGFIRQLPNASERERIGGGGVYYHNSYWGPDNESYMWLNSTPYTQMYEELSKAIDYNATKNWILNVGDMVPGQFSLEFFLQYAYDADKYDSENVYEFGDFWGTREFGETHGQAVGDILKRYAQYTNVRKLEQMAVDLFTNVHFSDEYERRMSMYQQLLDDAEGVYESLPEHKKAAFYLMVLYQVRSAYNYNAQFYYATKATTAMTQGKSVTAYNSYLQTKTYFEAQQYENSYFNKVVSNGKWDGILGPNVYLPPVAAGLAEAGAIFEIYQSGAGVVVEGEYKQQDQSTLSFGNYAQGRKFIDVFATGYETVSYSIDNDYDWIKVSSTSGEVTDESRLWVSVDFTKLNEGDTTGQIFVNVAGIRKEITIRANKSDFSLGEKVYVEQDGYISMEAEHYSSKRETADATIETIKDLGRVEGDMIRVISKDLISQTEMNYLEKAPYVAYDTYFENTGTFPMEVYRFPTLDALGYIRFAVQVDDNTPQIIYGEPDYGVGNYDWEFGIFNQIFKHNLEIDILSKGKHTIKIYMIDPYITLDKLVVYTEGFKPSYLGPNESYNSTFNLEPTGSFYDPYYQSTFRPHRDLNVKSTWGNGYLVEQNNKLLIEAEYAAEESPYAYTSNPTNGGWLLSRNLDGYTMRTIKKDINYTGQIDIAPTLNYQVWINNPGTYKVWIRYNAPFPSGDSFGFGVNGNQVFDVQGGLFSWNREESFEWRNTKTVYIGSAGVHTLNIFAQEDGFIIDQIYLTKGTENPNNGVAESVRSPYYDKTQMTITNADLAQRTLLKNAINQYAKNYLNIGAGDGVGGYDLTKHDEYQDALSNVFILYHQAATLNVATVTDAINQLNQKYTSLIESKIMHDEIKNYLLYEDFEFNHVGFEPFGLGKASVVGAVNTNVYQDGDIHYLAVRTFNENLSRIQSADLFYDFLRPATGEVVIEAGVKYNQARWGNMVYVLNEKGEIAVAVAFENSNGPSRDIVAYDGNTKVKLGQFQYNTWTDIKVVANTISDTFDLLVNGEKVNAKPLAFRNVANSLNQYKFGAINSVDSNFGLDYIKVYESSDVITTDVNEIASLISMSSPSKFDTNLTLPNVPATFEITIDSISNTNVLSIDGHILVPYVDTTVSIVLNIKNTDTNETALTEEQTLLIPGVSQIEVNAFISESVSTIETMLPQIPVGTSLGLYSDTDKQTVNAHLSTAAAALSNNLRYDEALLVVSSLNASYETFLQSRYMTDDVNQYYIYEDFDFYSEGQKPFGIEFLGKGTNTNDVSFDGLNGLYHLTTGSSSEAYNKINLEQALSGVITAEVKFKDLTTASGTFTNLIFFMSETTTTPVISIAIDRPASTSTLKYNDGSGWKSTTTENVTYIPGEESTVKAVIDFNQGKIDVYYNEVLVYQNISFRVPAAKDSITSFMFGTTKSNQNIYFDSIKVYGAK